MSNGAESNLCFFLFYMGVLVDADAPLATFQIHQADRLNPFQGFGKISSEHPLFAAERQRASSYLQEEFGLNVSPGELTTIHVGEIRSIRHAMGELSEVARQDQQIVNLSTNRQHETINGWDRIRATNQRRIDELMNSIGSFSIINRSDMRAKFNGRVSMSGETRDEQALSGVLFLLNNKRLNYATTRVIHEYTMRTFQGMEIPPSAWGEIAQKFDVVMDRWDLRHSETFMHTLPNWMRLVIYAQRMGVYNEGPGFIRTAMAQAGSVNKLDTLVRALRRRSDDLGSKEECLEIIRQITTLPLLHSETGALRYRGEKEKGSPSTKQVRLNFLLESVRGVGIEGADWIRYFVKHSDLGGRSDLGNLSSKLRGNISAIAGAEARKNPDKLTALIADAGHTADYLGREPAPSYSYVNSGLRQNADHEIPLPKYLLLYAQGS